MKGFIQDIESLVTKNRDFRRVLYTAKHCQLVLMSIPPGEEIGEEVHAVDQFFRVEIGIGAAVLNDMTSPIAAGFAILVPAGMTHNFINTGSLPLNLYTLYSPPKHRDGVIHRTRAEADAAEEYFDGITTESKTHSRQQ